MCIWASTDIQTIMQSLRLPEVWRCLVIESCRLKDNISETQTYVKEPTEGEEQGTPTLEVLAHGQPGLPLPGFLASRSHRQHWK
jgi:hypothetical protein